jgi:transketolase
VVHTEPIEFEIGKAIRLREGGDATIISTGGMLHNAVAAAELLAASGIRARVLSMHTLKPLDDEAVLAAARETAAVFTLEEHSILGGLGGAVSELLAEADGVSVPFRRLGIPSHFAPRVGSPVSVVRARSDASADRRDHQTVHVAAGLQARRGRV